MKILLYAVELLVVSTSVLSKRGTCRSDERFPDKFQIGVASSAYQIEGAWNEDGKGPNVWDTFTHENPGKVVDRSNADQSGDSYHLYREWDVPCIKSIKMDHYCLSISWARVLPDGTLANINMAGIQYYTGLLNDLIRNGIDPVVTMTQFDLPQSIQDLGGYTNEVAVEYFEAYAGVLFHYFGHLVKRWITFNSPYLLCIAYYDKGQLSPTIEPAPGIGQYLCGQNVLKAHAAAYRLYQDRYAKRCKGQVGISLYSNFYYSETDNDYDVEKALAFELGWFADPIFSRKGNYPKIMRREIAKSSRREGYYPSRLPKLSKEWMRKIRGSADFLGLVYYTSRIVKTTWQPSELPANDTYYPRDAHLRYTVRPEWKQSTAPAIYSVPHGLGDLLRYIKRKYDNPCVFITANGWSDNGEFIDLDRIDYIKSHLKEVATSIRKYGCNVVGYSVWSVYNSFEYLYGYTAKYGLFDCNYADPRLPLTPKASAEYMREVASTHCIPENVDIRV